MRTTALGSSEAHDKRELTQTTKSSPQLVDVCEHLVGLSSSWMQKAIVLMHSLSDKLPVTTLSTAMGLDTLYH